MVSKKKQQGRRPRPRVARQCTVSFYLTADEHAAAKRMAASEGLTLAGWTRRIMSEETARLKMARRSSRGRSRLVVA
jgi:hypothetical protein